MAVTLNGWKQIAAFLRQSVQTTKSLEREGLPVHRGKGENAVIFAFPAELVHWLQIYSGNRESVKTLLTPRHSDQARIQRNRELRSSLREQMALAKSRSAALRKAVASAIRAGLATSELHDDVGQRLTLLRISMDEIEQEASGNPELLRRISQVKDELGQIQSDVQALSHALHSTRLEILGIGLAMKGLCRDLAERRKVQIDFESLDVPSSVPWSVELCLYRVLQECLHNALKHSHTRRIQVRLRGTSVELHLVVADSGMGFDMRSASSSGLGLTSIRERVRLEGGTVIITSKPKHGATIHACVPLPQSASIPASRKEASH
jgi:signal transduction histidine kinase